MRIRAVAVCCIGMLLLAGCGGNGKKGESAGAGKAGQSGRSSIYDSTTLLLDSLTNALVEDDEGNWVRLKDSEYSSDSGGSPLDREYIGIGDFVFADLNRDGYQDAIALMSENSGGSGIFNSLVVFMNHHGTPVFTASYFIGDREGYDSIRVEGPIMDVFLKVHGPDDPMCCPTMRVEKRMQLVGDSIVVVGSSGGA